MSQSKKWTDTHQKRYTWLYNWLTSEQDLIKIPESLNRTNYLTQIPITTLIKAIKKNTLWGASSTESIYFMIARWFEVHDPKNNEIAYIKQLGFDIKHKRDEEEGENQLDEKEKINYRDHKYFTNILNNIDVSKINSLLEHNKYLILMLLVKQPPVRTNFYITAQFVTKPSDIKDNQNYIYLKTIAGKQKAFYIINKDKVSSTRTYKNNDELTYIDVTDESLTQLLYDSYAKYQRVNLFESNKKQITDKTLLRYLRDITKVSGITIDIMRSSYITHFYEQNRTYKSRDVLAKQMRHSQQTATRNYNKVFELSANEITTLKQENIMLKNKIIELENKINNK